MSETSKLFSSVLMIGAGFGAASLMGPPQLAEGLAEWVRPKPASDPYGLRPLTSGATAVDPAGWPTLPAAAPAPPADARPLRPAPAAVAADTSVRPASWPNERHVAPARTSGAAPQPSAEASPAGDWLTASSLWSTPRAGEPHVAEPAASRVVAAKPSLPPLETPAVCESCRVADSAAKTPRRLPPVPREPTPTATSLETPRLETPRLEVPRLAESRRVVSASPAATPPPAWPPLTPPANESSRFDPLATQATAIPAPSSSPWGATPAAAAPEPLARTALPAAEPEFVRHVIADGDTLESIARRYLGDPARAGELFELNRDRLDDPQLLPIGMVVLAPRRTTTQTAVTQFRVPQRAPASATAIAQPVAYPHAGPEATTQRDRLRHFGGPSDETVTPARPSPPAVWDRDANWDATGW